MKRAAFIVALFIVYTAAMRLTGQAPDGGTPPKLTDKQLVAMIIPLLADSERIHTLSELGVILLMFALGLEFSVRKLIRLGPTSGFITALQVGFMIWLGYVCGRALGWTPLESNGASCGSQTTILVSGRSLARTRATPFRVPPVPYPVTQ